MKLSDMRTLLTTRGIQLTKSLGQNFLHDANQLKRIAGLAELKPDDRVLEIGPGLGPLTEALLKQAGYVMAIEKDGRLVEVLKERFLPETSIVPQRLELIHDDALDVLRNWRKSWAGWKLVSNLPYSVASPILVELAHAQEGPERMVATLQLEVARRVAAGPGHEDYGLLSLLIQLDYEPKEWFKIPAGCFFPEPDVDSACIALVKREHRLLDEGLRPVFVRVVKTAFSQRRKIMLKLLKQNWPAAELEAAYSVIGLDPKVRAEALGIHQFVALTKQLSREPTGIP